MTDLVLPVVAADGVQTDDTRKGDALAEPAPAMELATIATVFPDIARVMPLLELASRLRGPGLADPDRVCAAVAAAVARMPAKTQTPSPDVFRRLAAATVIDRLGDVPWATTMHDRWQSLISALTPDTEDSGQLVDEVKRSLVDPDADPARLALVSICLALGWRPEVAGGGAGASGRPGLAASVRQWIKRQKGGGPGRLSPETTPTLIEAVLATEPSIAVPVIGLLAIPCLVLAVLSTAVSVNGGRVHTRLESVLAQPMASVTIAADRGAGFDQRIRLEEWVAGITQAMREQIDAGDVHITFDGLSATISIGAGPVFTGGGAVLSDHFSDILGRLGSAIASSRESVRATLSGHFAMGAERRRRMNPPAAQTARLSAIASRLEQRAGGRFHARILEIEDPNESDEWVRINVILEPNGG